jgi:DNA-binding NarL/FixJ family response regulator
MRSEFYGDVTLHGLKVGWAMPQEKTCTDSVSADEYNHMLAAYRASVAQYISSLEEMRAAKHRLREIASRLGFGDDLPAALREIDESFGRHDRNQNNWVVSPVDHLSARELEVLTLVGQGISTHEIAARLALATSTVETYRERLKTKLNLDSGVALIRHAVIWVNGRNGMA